MTVYLATIGTSLLLVDGDSEDHVRRAVGERLGYKAKPWLWRDMPVVAVEGDELEDLKARLPKVWKAPEIKDPTKGRKK